MLINMLVKKSLSTKGICLCLKNLFSTMPYYREMAKKLNITVKFYLWKDTQIE